MAGPWEAYQATDSAPVSEPSTPTVSAQSAQSGPWDSYKSAQSTQATEPKQPSVAQPTTGLPHVDKFKEEYSGAAAKAGKELGIDPSLILAQWGHETGWGKSIIPGTNNLGNIKGKGGVEATDNQLGTKDTYAKYKDNEEFVNKYVDLIKRKYPDAVNAGKDAGKFTSGLKGYAEDKDYANKVSSAVKRVGEVAQETQKEAPSAPDKKTAPSGPILEAKKELPRLAKNAVSVADMVISFPGQALGMAAGAAAGVGAALGGASHQEVQQVRAEAAKKYTEANPLNNIVHATMVKAGYTDGYEKSDVDAVMGKVAGGIEKGGEWVEKASGGVVGKGDFNDLANAALFLVAPKVAEGAGKAISDVASGVKAGAKIKPFENPFGEDPAAPKGLKPHEMDSKDPAAQKNQAAAKAKNLVVAADEQTPVDKRAAILMRNGVDPRTVEALEKSNPDVAEKVKEMAAHQEKVVSAETYKVEGNAIDQKIADITSSPSNEYFTKTPEELDTLRKRAMTSNDAMDAKAAQADFKPEKVAATTEVMDTISQKGAQEHLDEIYLGLSPKSVKGGQSGNVNPKLLGALGIATIGAMMDQKNPIEGALFGLAAGGLAYAGIGLAGKAMAKAEFSKLGEEAWKPDFNTIASPRYMERALQWTKSASQADTTVLHQHVENAHADGITEAMDKKFRDYSEGSVKDLTPQEHELYQKHNAVLDKSIEAERAKLDPQFKADIEGKISTRLAKSHRAWWENIGSSREGVGPGGFQKMASAGKARTVFALPDGTIVTNKSIGNGKWLVTAWEKNAPTVLGESKGRLEVGKDFQGMSIKGAKQADIHANTPVRYVESDLATKAVKLAELMKYNREHELLENIMSGEGTKGLFMKEGSADIPSDWVKVPNGNRFPVLGNKFMPKEYAEVFEDFLKRNGGSDNVLEGLKNISIRAMMLNPFPHMMNEMAHWYDSRGISGFLTPTGAGKYAASKGLVGLAKTMPDAIRSVIIQDKFQIELQKSGGMLQYPSVKNANAWQSILQTGLTDAVKTGQFKEMAKALGTSPARLASRVSGMGSAIMWASRDVLYTQLVKEQMLMGKTMEESIKEVGIHMPEYKIPSRIISQKPIGRLASQAVQSPLLVFGPYHYGLTKAVAHMGKEILSGKMGEMTKGLDRAAALMVGFYVMYPLLDNALQTVFGNDNIKQRRAGPYHIMDTAGEIMSGHKDPSALIMSLLTPNPIVGGAMEALNNRYGFSGQPIVHQGTSATTKAIDVGRFVGSKLAPAQAGLAAKEGRLSMEEYAYKQLDIIATSPEKEARAEKYRRMNQRAGRAHERKLQKAYGYGDE